MERVRKTKQKLLECLGDIDEDMEMHVIEESMPSVEEFKASIRKTVISQEFVPVFVGSAYKNKGVQTLLDGVIDYLPSPVDVRHEATDPTQPDRPKVKLSPDPKDPLLFLAFKLEENKFGQLTWVRVYQGTLRKGQMIQANVDDPRMAGKSKKIRLSRIVRLHSDELQDISTAQSGEICAMFGVDCVSGTTFSDGKCPYLISDLHVPETVVSLAIKPKSKTDMAAFGKAIDRFKREDPTFKSTVDDMTGDCVIRGMGELHLDIYIERIRREYGVECEVGRPRVNYQECITKRVNFDYLHKKQSGGRGQYARIIGYMEPNEENSDYKFVNDVRGTGIPPQFIKSVEGGFQEMCERGPLVGGPIVGLKVVLQDGVTHEVDSSDFAFRNAAKGCFRHHLEDLEARVTEPHMKIDVVVPEPTQPSVVGDLVSRGITVDSIQYSANGKTATIKCVGPLDTMFGYVTLLRSMTEGKGELSMEYSHHDFVDPTRQETLLEEYQEFLVKQDD
jgi:elongation factor G